MKISPAKTAATPASRNSVVVVIVMSVLPGLDRYPERCVHRHFLREGDGVVCAGPRTESTARHDVAHIGRRSRNGRFLSADSHRGIRAAWRILVVWMAGCSETASAGCIWHGGANLRIGLPVMIRW